jgi:hypothetical protein
VAHLTPHLPYRRTQGISLWKAELFPVIWGQGSWWISCKAGQTGLAGKEMDSG